MITKPQDMLSVDPTEAIAKFEKQFKEEEKNLHYYHLVIVGEYNRVICDKIEEIYTKAGWRNVECKTSSEKRERPGLTGLHLRI